MNTRTEGGIQSLDAALHLLATLAAGSTAMTLTELARAAGMPVTKAHRYLASFAAAGLVEQRGRSGRYDLGPAALAIGLAAISRNDHVNRTAEALPGLASDSGLTALLSVWGDRGPTVVRWQRAASFVITTLGLGSTLPLIDSATGRVCVAFLPEAVTGDLLRRELAAARRRAAMPTAAEVAAMIDGVRADGHASVDGRFIPGLAAISAPVLDWQGEAACVVTLIGTDAAITAPDGPALQALKTFCGALSLA